MNQLNRNEIRKSMRRMRRALPTPEKEQAAQSLAAHLACQPLFRNAKHIALYLPNDGELDPTLLFERAWSMGKKCYLPVLSPIFHNKVWFAPYFPGDALRINRFGIPEPDINWRGMRSPKAIDLVMTPLVAFDLIGNRLGMGGGFYDRTLAYLHRHRVWRKPRLLGIAYEFQKVERLPDQPWDVPLSAIATEATIYATERCELRL